jgi:hypothetical protein
MCSFFDDIFFDSRETIKDDCPGSTADIVDCTVVNKTAWILPLCSCEEDCGRDGNAGAKTEDSLHDV